MQRSPSISWGPAPSPLYALRVTVPLESLEPIVKGHLDLPTGGHGTCPLVATNVPTGGQDSCPVGGVGRSALAPWSVDLMPR